MASNRVIPVRAAATAESLQKAASPKGGTLTANASSQAGFQAKCNKSVSLHQASPILAKALGHVWSRSSFMRLIENGVLRAYRLTARGHWWIERESLQQLIERLRNPHPNCRDCAEREECTPPPRGICRLINVAREGMA